MWQYIFPQIYYSNGQFSSYSSDEKINVFLTDIRQGYKDVYFNAMEMNRYRINMIQSNISSIKQEVCGLFAKADAAYKLIYAIMRNRPECGSSDYSTYSSSVNMNLTSSVSQFTSSISSLSSYLSNSGSNILTSLSSYISMAQYNYPNDGLHAIKQYESDIVMNVMALYRKQVDNVCNTFTYQIQALFLKGLTMQTSFLAKAAENAETTPCQYGGYWY